MDPTLPTGPTLEPPPLPPPRDPLPCEDGPQKMPRVEVYGPAPIQVDDGPDPLDTLVGQDDEDMDSGGEWQIVMKDRKQNILEEKNSLVKEKGKKGVTKPLSKFLETEPMEEQIGEVTGLEVASVLGQMSQGELPEVTAESCWWRFQTPRWEPGRKGQLFQSFLFRQTGRSQSAKPGRFPSFEPASFAGVVAGTKGCT